MASLTCEELHMDVQRAPFVTEAALRSVFREELGSILALLHDALGTKTCRFPYELAPSYAGTGVDATGTRPGIARSATSIAQVHSHRPTDATHTIGTETCAGMVSNSVESQDNCNSKFVACHRIYVQSKSSGESLEQSEDMLEQTCVLSPSSSAESADISERDKAMLRQISNDSTTPIDTSDLQVPSWSYVPPSVAPEVLLPGEIVSAIPDEQREAAKHSPVMSVSFDMAEAFEVIPNPNKARNTTDTSPGLVLAPSVREFTKSTLEDHTGQTTSRITLSRWVTRIVGHSIFDYIVASFIMLNGFLVGVQADHLARELTDETPAAFLVLEMIFCAIFTAELCLRLCAYGRKFLTMPGKAWNLFDLFVVMAQILEVGMEAMASGMGFSFNLLRVLRLIRIIRLARALHLVVELRTIVSSIAGSMKTLFWTCALLFMVVYVLGVYITQVVLNRRIAFREDDAIAPADLELYWGSLSKSIMSLFQSITGGIDWNQVERPLTDHIGAEMGILFSMYIGFTVFCMLNVVTGVLMELGMENAKREHDLRAMNHFMQLFAKLDVKKTGEIAWEDFHQNLHKEEMHDFFHMIDVDIDNAQALFELLDVDSSGFVDVRKFMDGCLGIWAPTRGLDLRVLLRDVNQVLGILLDHNGQRNNVLPRSIPIDSFRR